MKILDRYILTSFLKTFFPLFIIIMFILLLQTIWLFINELAGKDLDFSVIIKFLTFATPRLIPMVLPLTILLTSTMIFGNFAENYEFAAMKSSGISLQRAMRTLSVFIFFVGIGAYIFSNTVIPASEKKFVNLRKNIVKVKPAMVISPNRFEDLGDINIKVKEKYGDNDEFLKDVIIHKKSNRPGNFTVIKATEGELKGSVNSDVITLVLKDGNYYDEVQQKSPNKRKKHPFAKAYFKEYILNMDLSELGDVDMDAQMYKKGYNMLNVNGIRNELDSISEQVNEEVATTTKDLNRRNGFNELNKNLKVDSLQTTVSDTLNLIDLFSTRERLQIYNLAFSNTDGAINRIKSTNRSVVGRQRALNKYEMSLHDKYALGIACVLLFFVGAPLGAIIRKGGLGLPIVVGVLLFLTYHFIGIFAKNSAEEGGIPPFVGSWLSTFIIFPLSIFLTYRATTDQGFFNLDSLIQPIRDFFAKKAKARLEKRRKQRKLDLGEEIAKLDQDPEVYTKLDASTSEELKDIARNYQQLGHDESYKLTALHILEERGVDLDSTHGVAEPLEESDLKSVKNSFANFNEYGILAVIISTFFVLINVVIILISKTASAETEVMLLIFNGLSILAYISFFALSWSSINKLYQKLGSRANKPNKMLLILLGLPLYILSFFYFRKEIRKDMKKIR